MKTTANNMNHKLMVLGCTLGLLLACSEALQHSGASDKNSSSDRASSAEGRVSTSATIAPSSSETQVIAGADGTDLQGAKVEIPPGSLDGDPSIEVHFTYGEEIANDTTAAYLTMPTPVTPVSIPADVSTEDAVVVNREIWITLPLTIDSNQHQAQLANPEQSMAIFYLREHGFGLAAETGALPGSLIEVSPDRRFVRFPVEFFGMMQIGFVSEPVVAPVRLLVSRQEALATNRVMVEMAQIYSTQQDIF